MLVGEGGGDEELDVAVADVAGQLAVSGAASACIHTMRA